MTGSYGTPTGTVTFYDRCTALGSVTLDSHSVTKTQALCQGDGIGSNVEARAALRTVTLSGSQDPSRQS